MRLNELLTPKSPRMVPGSAFEPKVRAYEAVRSIAMASPCRRKGQDDDRRTGHECDKAGIKGLAAVRLIMRLGKLLGNFHELRADDFQALALEARRDDLANGFAAARRRA